jgi:hypothetical protein
MSANDGLGVVGLIFRSVGGVVLLEAASFQFDQRQTRKGFLDWCRRAEHFFVDPRE